MTSDFSNLLPVVVLFDFWKWFTEELDLNTQAEEREREMFFI